MGIQDRNQGNLKSLNQYTKAFQRRTLIYHYSGVLWIYWSFINQSEKDQSLDLGEDPFRIWMASSLLYKRNCKKNLDTYFPSVKNLLFAYSYNIITNNF